MCVKPTRLLSRVNWSYRRGRDRLVVGFTTTCAISGYHPNPNPMLNSWK